MRTRHGFTLLEVLVALVIGAILLLGARGMLEQLGDTADRVAALATTADRDANTERIIRQLFSRTTVGDGVPFAGSPHQARFTSWCDMPAGWRERCQVHVAIEAVRNTMDATPFSVVTVRTSAGERWQLPDSTRHAMLGYLDDPADGGRWRPNWSPLDAPPLVVGIMRDRDTLLFPIGRRQ